MNGLFMRGFVLGAIVGLAGASPVWAQLALRPEPRALPEVGDVRPGELHGIVYDQRGDPLPGAVVSVTGTTTSFAVSDRDGRFAFRNLPPGAYLVRAHLQGHQAARGRTVQVNPDARSTWNIVLTRRSEAEALDILTAGVGVSETTPAAQEPPTQDTSTDAPEGQNEVAWRLRHGRRSVLRDTNGLATAHNEESFIDDLIAGLGRTAGSPARLASALFSDVSLNGQVNLLTTASFERPQDLFSMNTGVPQPVAYVSLVAPSGMGEWMVRGAVTQGDLSSWIVAGSYVRSAETAHAYEAGLSYSIQRYRGGNAEALVAMRDGSRNVGSVYAYDHWQVSPRWTVSYGAKIANYDYMPVHGLVSPRAAVTVQPLAGDSLRVRASVSHRESAPGAEEFLPPAMGLWLPPERTFSSLSQDGFRAERLDHFEVAAEREWGDEGVIGARAFRQRVSDQAITLFGLRGADGPGSLGHYHVASAGDFEANGWGVSVKGPLAGGVSASLDYTQIDAEWVGVSPDRDVVARFAGSLLRSTERIHDVTASVESVVAPTATRVIVFYRVNTGFASRRPEAVVPGPGTRFDVQVSQVLPFFRWTGAQWETLVAVTNVFREDVSDRSMYDELLVFRSPTRLLGGVAVRF
jgi:hypothetical protein